MKKRNMIIAAALAATMVFGSAVGVMAAVDTDLNVSESDNKIKFDGGGGEPTDSVDPEKPDEKIIPDEKEKETENTGPLRLDCVPIFDFGTQKITTEEKTYDAAIPYDTMGQDPVPYYVQVTDVRGTGAGWRLSAKMTKQFTDSNGHTLKGATIALSNVAVLSQKEAIVPGSVSDGTLEYDADNDKTIQLASAAVGEGMGVSSIRFGDEDLPGQNADKSVQLTVPANGTIYKDTYTATILWTLAETP